MHLQLARELEAAKARVEEEVLATVHIATGLETRLRAAKDDAEAAQEAAVLAQQKAQQVLAAHANRCSFAAVIHTMHACIWREHLWWHCSRAACTLQP